MAFQPTPPGTENKWANPRPPAGAGPPTFRSYNTSGKSVPNLQPLLGPRPAVDGSRKGHIGSVPSLGAEHNGGLIGGEGGSTGGLQRIELPLSARERRGGHTSGGRRALSIGEPELPLTARSPRQPEHAISQGSSIASTEDFLRGLVGMSGEGLDENALTQLAALAGSQRQHEVVKLLQDIRFQLDRGVAGQTPSQALAADVDQLAAQVTFMEKKIWRLREKLKRQAREAATKAPPGGILNPKSEDEMTVQREEDGTAREQANSREVQHDEVQAALRKRIASLRTQMWEMATAKDAADTNATVARGLASKVEASLRDAALAREAERIKLEAEQELLRRRVSEQDQQLMKQVEYSSATGAVHPGGLGELKAKVKEAEQELAALRAKAKAEVGLGLTLGQGSELPASVEKPLLEEAVPPQEEYERLLLERDFLESEHHRLTGELEQARRGDADLVGDLEDDLARAESEAQWAEVDRGRQLTDILMQRQAEFDAEAEAHYQAQRQGEEGGVVLEALAEQERLSEELRIEAENQHKQAQSRLRHFEARLAYVQHEFLYKQDQQALAIQRQYDIRARFFLGLRPSSYDRDVLLHFLSFALGVSRADLEVLEEERVPEMTDFRQLAVARGQALPSSGDRWLQEVLRPLRAPEADELGGEAEEETEVEESKLGAEDPARAAAAQGLDEDGEAGATSTSSLLRVVVNVTRGSKSPADLKVASERLAIVERLYHLVGAGGSLLEDMAIVSMSRLLGSTAFDESHQLGELVTRVRRNIDNCRFVITARRTVEPNGITLMAVDHPGQRSFILCLNDDDLRVLFGDQSPLRLQPELGRDLVEALVSMLHVVTAGDQKEALVAVNSVLAPRTVLNAGPIMSPSSEVFPANGPEENSALETGDDGGAMSIAIREASVDRATVEANEETSEATTLSFEDVLLFEDRYFNLSVFQDCITGGTTVRLEDHLDNRCAIAVLPAVGEGGPAEGQCQQLRVFAQAYEFRHMVLLLAVENVAVPPGLLVRVARAGGLGPQGHRAESMEQRVYWLSLAGPDDGDFVLTAELAGVPGTANPEAKTVSEIPAQHRQRLLAFLQDGWLSPTKGVAAEPPTPSPRQ